MEKQKGFTLIELLVVIAIIGLLSTLAVISLNNARAKSRDSKRVADVKQMMTALELYFNDYNQYPTYITDTNFTGRYMQNLPQIAMPQDGSCDVNDNNYTDNYVPTGASPHTSYTVTYCLGGTTGGLSAGVHTASPSGM